LNKINTKERYIAIAGSLKLNNKILLSNFKININLKKWNTIIGQSGLGKSTLLKIIANLDIPENFSHSIKINNKNLYRFSWMAQDDLLLPWLTVIENIFLGESLRREKINFDKAHNLLNKVGLTSVANNLPSTLSGGMKQRVALARTLFEDNDIILMDEPFTSLDSATKMHIQELAFTLLKDKTVLMVTHDPLEALLLSNSLYIISNKNIKNIKLPNTLPLREINNDTLSYSYNNILKIIQKSYEEQ